MKLSHLLTVLLAGAAAFFISGAQSSPHLQAPMGALLPLQAGLKCGLVNGELVCGNKNSGGKHHDDDHDGNDDDDDHQGKGKKKNTDDDAGLSECTIQQSGGGGGCKGGFKQVCEKMKSGKKCCGCVPDKNEGTSAGQSAPTGGGGIKPIDEKPADTLLLPYFECDLSKGEPCNLNGQK